MPKTTRTSARERLDLLLRTLAREADYCDRKAQTKRADAEQLQREFNRGIAGYALGYAEANENFARQLRALIADVNGDVN